MKLLNIFLLFFLNITLCIAQANKVINFHIDPKVKRGSNQWYINRKLNTLVFNDTTFFSHGYVIKDGDTITTDIYVPDHKITKDFYLFIVIRLSSDSIIALTPKDIQGYCINGLNMKSHRSIAASDTNYFFIRQLETGNVTLYCREAVPSDEQFVYYFRKKEDAGLLFFDPDKKSDYYMQEWDVRNNPSVSRYSRPDEKQFIAVFSEYLKDCQSVRNKITEGFYTANDLERIIKEYNRCKK